MASYRLTFLTLPLAAASIALGACGGGDPATAGTGDQRAEFREAALKYARCMRAHGVDMPDPKFEDGGVQITLDGTDPNDPKVKEAHDTCAKKAGLPEPKKGTGGVSGAGGGVKTATR
jgi:hypothetical protein